MSSMGTGGSRRAAQPVATSLLDRLMDAEPDRAQDRPVSAVESRALLRRSVHRDVEALLNARRPWRSLQKGLDALRVSPVQYGMPDFTAGTYNDHRQRDFLCGEVRETIRRFEPRLEQVQVRLTHEVNLLRPTLQLRIDALLRTHAASEPITFDTTIDTTTADVTLNPLYGA